ncbi:uncharacterized protein LOC142112129 [Mixophyes fleayi]|uniref:uncharacterized protein LOC142112129 n=1 Tax=Mixophyes fleayi TaxID=3061075 RepID=UPI003F4DB74A
MTVPCSLPVRRLRTVQPPSYIPTVFLVVFIVSVTLVGMGIIVVGVLIKRMKRYKRALRNMYSVSSQEPVYEEIDLRMMKKYQSVSQESVFYPDGLDEKLEYYTSEERLHMTPEPGSSLENKMTEYDDTGLSYENLNNDETTTDGSKGQDEGVDHGYDDAAVDPQGVTADGGVSMDERERTSVTPSCNGFLDLNDQNNGSETDNNLLSAGYGYDDVSGFGKNQNWCDWNP